MLPLNVTCGVNVSFSKYRNRNCAPYPRELCNMTNLVLECYGLPVTTNKFSYALLRSKHVSTLTIMSKLDTQVIHLFALRSHLKKTLGRGNV